jgi:Flp pilus assembly protein TadD
MSAEPTVRGVAQARQLLRLNRPDEAAVVLSQAIASDPANAECHRLIAQCLIQLNLLPEALEEVDTSLSLDPASEWGFRLRSITLLGMARSTAWLGGLLGMRKRRAGLRAAREAVRLSPTSFLPFVQLANAYLANRNPWAAANAAEQAVQLAPTAPIALNMLGLVALRLGRVQAAEVAFRRTLRVDPHNAEALNNLGVVARASGRRTEAPEQFGASARAKPRTDFGALNAARMSNALVGQSLLTGFLLLLLVGYQSIALADQHTVWWLGALAAGGLAYGTIRVWRAERDSYRPGLLAFSLRGSWRAASVGVAALGGLVGALIAGPVGGVFVATVSLLIAFRGLGRGRSGSSSGRPLRMPFLVLLIVTLGLFSVAALVASFLFIVRLFAAPMSSGPSTSADFVGFGITFIVGTFCAGATWALLRAYRWRRGGGSDFLDRLAANAEIDQPTENAV